MEAPVMSPAGWEHQALESIQSALGHTDPKLASLLATFTRLTSSEDMPAHEKAPSSLRHLPYRRRSRPHRARPPHHHRSRQLAVILTWIITSIAMITVAVILSRGGPAACPQAFGICGG
jgi:UDP-N-acetylmuramyl pentapeptide phosphotransferase/UDP-N-acetylglucosamine-1-phosphate transferase